MSRVEYRKLVRDRIPEIIARTGRACETVRLEETEYRQALRAKLVEEAQEALAASDAQLARELADVFEVLEALAAAYRIPWSDVVGAQQEARQERGGFSKRVMLIWAEDDGGG